MALDLLGLELQAAVSGMTWVLGLNSGPLEEQQVLLAPAPLSDLKIKKK